MSAVYIKDMPITEDLIEEKLQMGLKELVKLFSNIYPLSGEDVYDEYGYNEVIDATKSVQWNIDERLKRNNVIYKLREDFDKNKEIAVKNIEKRLVKYIQEKAGCSLEKAQKAWYYLKGLRWFMAYIDYDEYEVTINGNLDEMIEGMIDFIKMQ